MKTSDDSDEKEKQKTEQPSADNQEEQKSVKQRRVHGPMQLRVFEKMGTRLSVKGSDSIDAKKD